MDTRFRLVGVSGAVLIIGLVLFVLVTLNTLPRTTRPSTLITPTVVASPEGSVGGSDLTK